MELPPINPVKRYDDGPELFLWEDKNLTVYKPSAAVVLPRDNPGAVVVAAEEANIRGPKSYYVLFEAISDDSATLFEHLLSVRKSFLWLRIWGRLTDQEENYISYRNDDLLKR